MVSQSSPSTPSVLRAGSGFESLPDPPEEEPPEDVVAEVSLTEPASPSPETEISWTELTSIPVTCIPTLLSNPQLLGPDDEHTAVTRFPLMSYESNPQPVAELTVPENSTTTVILS